MSKEGATTSKDVVLSPGSNDGFTDSIAHSFQKLWSIVTSNAKILACMGTQSVNTFGTGPCIYMRENMHRVPGDVYIYIYIYMFSMKILVLWPWEPK